MQPAWILLIAVLIVLGGILGLALLIFTIYAWVRRDPLARFLAQLTLLWVVLLFLLVLVFVDLGEMFARIQRGSSD